MFKRKAKKELIHKYSDRIEDYQDDSVVTDIIININTVRVHLDSIKDEIKSRRPISDTRWIFFALKLDDLNEQYRDELRKLEQEYFY